MRRIRERAGGGGGTPAIAVSARTTGEDSRRAREAGFDLNFEKPVDVARLVRAIRSVSRSRRGQASHA
jgi:DNA-binding response OmpR family regulator